MHKNWAAYKNSIQFNFLAESYYAQIQQKKSINSNENVVHIVPLSILNPK
jgi:hypothetical protein